MVLAFFDRAVVDSLFASLESTAAAPERFLFGLDAIAADCFII